MRWRFPILATCFALVSVPLPAEDYGDDELVAERIHSNLPLYTFEWDELWPRGFNDGNDFGCESRVGFGDWQERPAGTEEDEAWWRFGNYGVFHCGAVIRSADERGELEQADWEYGFFVRLGEAKRDGEPWELWAIQQGTVPGSNYMLALAKKMLKLPSLATIERIPDANEKEAPDSSPDASSN